MSVAATAGAGTAAAELWYVRRGQQVYGPYAWDVVQRNVGLGRVRGDDSLSQDRLVWRAVEDLVALPSGALRALPAFDERRGERRATDTTDAADPEQRSGGERRVAESPTMRERRARSARVWAGLRPTPPAARRALLLTGLVLTVLVAFAVVSSIPRERHEVDCSGAPRAGANWDYCNKSAVTLDDARLDGLSARSTQFSGARLAAARLRRADLSYANLSGADLRLADLRGARLLGAGLRQASLNHADLSGADLRYADLNGAGLDGVRLIGARLDHAIWTDGRLCALNSVGHCAR